MNFSQIVTTVLGSLGTISAIVFAVIAYRRSNRTDNQQEGKQEGTLFTEIGYIKSGIDDIKHKQEKQDDKNETIVTKLASVEASVKQAHKRIDHLEEVK